ncbi:MAG: hypothetical protein L0Y72_13055 [Gemmataceae bacterium]|nr:hypothetical protein [Gemmataceae bacterium]MCI0739966.1 hypothetical protein [Gemmataceae bacterium]
MDELILDRLLKSPKAAALLDELCDFQALDEPPPDWFVLASEEPLQVVGRDGAGGRFCLHQPPSGGSALLFVSSEGEAGVIAGSLAAGVAMMAALPYWRDCLKFSSGGRLDEMRRAQGEFESQLRARRPNIDEVRGLLFRALGVSAPDTPLEALHEAVSGSGSRQVVATRDRNPFASLFNTFDLPDRPA